MSQTRRLEKGAEALDNFAVLSGLQSATARMTIGSDSIRSLELFRDLNPDFVSAVLEDMDVQFFAEGDTILHEGDKEKYCYILNRGEVSVQVGGNEVAKLADGSIFGEICLLGLSQHRTATVVALSFCDVRLLYADKFQFALLRFPKERAHFRKEAKRRMAEIRDKAGVGHGSAQPNGRRRSSLKCIPPPKFQAQDLDHRPPKMQAQDLQSPRRRSLISMQPKVLTHSLGVPVSSRKRSMPDIVGNVLRNVAQKDFTAHPISSLAQQPVELDAGLLSDDLSDTSDSSETDAEHTDDDAGAPAKLMPSASLAAALKNENEKSLTITGADTCEVEAQSLPSQQLVKALKKEEVTVSVLEQAPLPLPAHHYELPAPHATLPGPYSQLPAQHSPLSPPHSPLTPRSPLTSPPRNRASAAPRSQLRIDTQREEMIPSQRTTSCSDVKSPEAPLPPPKPPRRRSTGSLNSHHQPIYVDDFKNFAVCESSPLSAQPPKSPQSPLSPVSPVRRRSAGSVGLVGSRRRSVGAESQRQSSSQEDAVQDHRISKWLGLVPSQKPEDII